MRSGGITRNSQIDGLRGYLATGVFLHHFYIAWGYEISGRWVAPENVIFRNLGLVAVSLFFMITAYLFYGKILSSQGKLNWRRLYVGRVQRLWPMYAVSIAVLLLIVATHTGFVAHESYLQLGWEALNWLAFTIPSAPDVNGYNGTASIVAAVTWTLRYEWLFYAILPLGAFFIRRFRPRIGWRIYALLMLAIVVVILPEVITLEFNSRLALPFICGALAFELRNLGVIQGFTSKASANFLVVAALLASLLLPFPNQLSISMVLITFAFILVVSGANVFGVLTHQISRRIGDATYSIYLLHGIVLHCTFQVMKALDVNLVSQWVWFVLPVIAAVVAAISLVTYQVIERPFLNLGRRRMVEFPDAAP